MESKIVWHDASKIKPTAPWTRCLLAYKQPNGDLLVLASVVFWNDGWKDVDIRTLPVEKQDRFDRITEPTYWAELPYKVTEVANVEEKE